MTRTQAYLYLITVVVVITVLFTILFSVVANNNQKNITEDDEGYQISDSELLELPLFTEETEKRLAASSGFQHVISYTDRGFEPISLTIANGDTVRFTNNSEEELRVVTRTTEANSSGTAPCRSETLDSCSGILPGDFWEFTFTLEGTWTVFNSHNSDNKVQIKVL